MPTPRHRSPRQRSIIASILLVVLGALIWIIASPGQPLANAATPAPKSACTRFDPNLVNGVCLKYQGRSGTGYSWIGSYRADDGKVFFCIDYLYDSRIVSSAAVVGTQPLQNQLGRRIGDAEVAALNYVISTWAPHGSTGSDQTDAAIALIIREVMSDAIQPDGTVTYQPGLKVGGTVAAPIGGLPGDLLAVARSMWSKASLYRGPARLVLAGGSHGQLELGQSEDYQVSVLTAANHPVPGLVVTFACTGPIRCPQSVRTRAVPVTITLTPTALGKASIKATTSFPAADGKLLKLPTWRTHGGSTASGHGVQRGWIGQRNNALAEASLEAQIVKGTPEILTRTSHEIAAPGTSLTDAVTVSGLPAGTTQQVTATLFGPMTAPPGADSCTEELKVGQVSFEVAANGTVTTPPVTVSEPGYYVWTESMPGDVRTNPVTTPCGITEETTVVQKPQPPTLHTPTVHTVASSQHALVGSPLHDLVDVGELPDGTTVEVRWALLGPVAPRAGSCDDLDWSGARTLAR